MPTQRNKATSSSIDFNCVNAATKQPVVYTGEAATLNVVLTNNTGSDIGLLAGGQPSTLEIFLPTFYQCADLQSMRIGLSGWAFSFNKTDETMVLTCTEAGEWANGAVLHFQITNATSSTAPPQSDFPQINPSGLSGNNIPSQVMADALLSLEVSSNGQNADLTTVLELSLDNDGVIYVSDNAGELIANSLSFNIKNTGSQLLYADTGPWNSTPQVLVRFVYGTTPGSLAPDNDRNDLQAGSAWNIQGNIQSSEDNDWAIQQPANQHPQWLMVPNPANLGILGTGDDANITFQFTVIVSLTPTGHTQMYALFSGFPGYNDHLFTLGINKQNLPSPGLIVFSSAVNKVTVHSDTQEVQIALSWKMTGVAEIVLDFSIDGIQEWSRKYPGTQPPLQQDTYTLSFVGITQSTSLTITCTAFDDNNNQLNDLQQTITIDFPPTITTYQGNLQADGSLLLQWSAQGATRFTVAGTTTLNNSLSIPSPVFPLLNNNAYALTATNDQEVSSLPIVFTQPKVFGVVQNPIPVGNAPLGEIAVSPDSQYIFVTNSGDNTVSIIEVNSKPPFQVLQTIAVGNEPIGIAASSDDRNVFVTNAVDDTISAIEFNSSPFFFDVWQTISAGNTPIAIAVSPDSQYIFMVSYGDTTVVVIKVKSNPPFDVSQTINVGKEPMGIAVSPDSQYVFVTNNADNTVSVIEFSSKPFFFDVSQTIDVGRNPIGIVVSPDSQYVFVTNNSDNTVSVIEVNSNPSFNVLQTIKVGNSPVGIATSPDGRYVFVTNNSDTTISIIEICSKPPFNVLQTINVDRNPLYITASPNGQYVFVTHSGNTVSVIEPTSVSI